MFCAAIFFLGAFIAVSSELVPEGCQAPNGELVDVGGSFKDKCNNCNCFAPGKARCTRMRCVGCEDSRKNWYEVGEMFMEQCNTCSCVGGEDGAFAMCTMMACLGCTDSKGGWHEAGESYKEDCNTCTCNYGGFGGGAVAGCTL